MYIISTKQLYFKIVQKFESFYLFIFVGFFYLIASQNKQSMSMVLPMPTYHVAAAPHAVVDSARSVNVLEKLFHSSELKININSKQSRTNSKLITTPDQLKCREMQVRAIELRSQQPVLEQKIERVSNKINKSSNRPSTSFFSSLTMPFNIQLEGFNTTQLFMTAEKLICLC